MPMTYAEHDKSLKSPGICELLPLRDIPRRDNILVLAIAALMNLLAHFVGNTAHVFGIPLNIFMEFAVPLLAVPFLILFKYGRPRGYLTDLAFSLFAPKAWSALERDSELNQPYILDDAE